MGLEAPAHGHRVAKQQLQSSPVRLEELEGGHHRLGERCSGSLQERVVQAGEDPSYRRQRDEQHDAPVALPTLRHQHPDVQPGSPARTPRTR